MWCAWGSWYDRGPAVQISRVVVTHRWHTWVRMYMYIHRHVYMCVYTCMHIHICIYVRIHAYTCTYIYRIILRYGMLLLIQRCMSDMHVVTHPEAQGIRSLVIFTFPSPHLPSPVCHTHSRSTPLPVSHTCQLPSYPTPFATDSHRHALTPFTLTATLWYASTTP